MRVGSHPRPEKEKIRFEAQIQALIIKFDMTAKHQYGEIYVPKQDVISDEKSG